MGNFKSRLQNCIYDLMIQMYLKYAYAWDEMNERKKITTVTVVFFEWHNYE